MLLVNVVIISALTRPQSEAGTVSLVSRGRHTDTDTRGGGQSVRPELLYSESLYAVLCGAGN